MNKALTIVLIVCAILITAFIGGYLYYIKDNGRYELKTYIPNGDYGLLSGKIYLIDKRIGKVWMNKPSEDKSLTSLYDRK